MIAVACGVLVDAQGRVLIAQRPAGKIAAGKWEFPGGKIEAGESAQAALQRELREELGIEVRGARPLIRLHHDYRDRSVLLDTWRIETWDGTPRGLETQQLAWCALDELHRYDLLEADGPILQALRLPAHYVFTPPQISEGVLLERLLRLPKNALLRLRLPELNERAYEALATRVIAASAPLGLRVLLDREPQQAQALGAAGWHASAARMAALRARPLPDTLLFAASAHDALQAQALHERDVDFAVIGSVCKTPTHPHDTALGWSQFSALAQRARRPAYAIGGVGPAQLSQAQAQYAQGVAGIRAYW